MNAIVVRAEVDPGLPYGRYRENLRFDFWYACAYCSIAETEAAGIGFNIDHYQPQIKGAADIHDYSNLMWSCAPCNRQKGDEWESDENREKGFRFVRPDEENPQDHYLLHGLLLQPITIAGTYTIEVLNLNRKSLRDLRHLRERLYKSKQAIIGGLQALSQPQLDRLPATQRARYFRTVENTRAQNLLLQTQTGANLVVRVLNGSPIIDPDPDKFALTKRRRDYLKAIRADVVLSGSVEEDS